MYVNDYTCIGERSMHIFQCDKFCSDVGQVSSDANDFPKTCSKPIYKGDIVIKTNSRAMYSVHWVQSLDIGITIAITCNSLSMESAMVRAWIDARMFNVIKSWGMFHPYSIDGVTSLKTYYLLDQYITLFRYIIMFYENDYIPWNIVSPTKHCYGFGWCHGSTRFGIRFIYHMIALYALWQWNITNKNFISKGTMDALRRDPKICHNIDS